MPQFLRRERQRVSTLQTESLLVCLEVMSLSYKNKAKAAVAKLKMSSLSVIHDLFPGS